MATGADVLLICRMLALSSCAKASSNAGLSFSVLGIAAVPRADEEGDRHREQHPPDPQVDSTIEPGNPETYEEEYLPPLLCCRSSLAHFCRNALIRSTLVVMS